MAEHAMLGIRAAAGEIGREDAEHTSTAEKDGVRGW
jgi:hypothetical protein